MSEKSIPVPSHVVDFVNKSKAKKVVERLQLENMLLKHLVTTLDPDFDYMFDEEAMEFKRVKKDGEVQSSPNKGESAGGGKDSGDKGNPESRPFRGTVTLGADA